jgi:hypothetical protein
MSIRWAGIPCEQEQGFVSLTWECVDRISQSKPAAPKAGIGDSTPVFGTTDTGRVEK